MKCEDLPQPFQNPLLIQKPITILQTHMALKLSDWLETVYGIARVGVKLVDKKPFKYPQIYLNNGKDSYLWIGPDSQKKSFSFFELNDAWNAEYDAGDNLLPTFVFDVGLVCWLNLRKIDNRNYDYTVELMADTIGNGLMKSPLASELKIISSDHRPERVFEKYSFRQEESQFLMYPYGGFRIDLELRQEVNLLCQPAFVVQGDPSQCPDLSLSPYVVDGYVNPVYVYP